MRTIGHSKILAFIAGIVLIGGSAACQGIFLDHVDGLDPEGNIIQGATLTFHMRVVGDGSAHKMLNNGFVFSSSALTWSGLTGEFVEPNLATWFDLVRAMNFWASGPPQDTVGIGLLSLFGPGLPAGYDDIMYTFTVGPVNGPATGILKLDSSWYPPTNPWMWDIVDENVAWGGPYLFFGDPPEPYTYCVPYYLKVRSLPDLIEIHIMWEDPAEIVWESVLIFGKIHPADGFPMVQDGHLVTACSPQKFLAVGGFRPITSGGWFEYTVEYDKIDGTHVVLTGEFLLCTPYCPGADGDGAPNLDDIVFMVDYLWRGGDTGEFFEEEINAIMDIDGNGRVDALDIVKLIQQSGY